MQRGPGWQRSFPDVPLGLRYVFPAFPGLAYSVQLRAASATHPTAGCSISVTGTEPLPPVLLARTDPFRFTTPEGAVITLCVPQRAA